VPTYYRPRVAHIEPGGASIGGLVLIAAGLGVAAAVVLFVFAHLVLLAVCAAVFAAVMGAVIAVMRRAASPRRWAEHRYPKPTVRIPAAESARELSAPPLAIEPARVLPALWPPGTARQRPGGHVPRAQGGGDHIAHPGS
jgi:hypothetical protein